MELIHFYFIFSVVVLSDVVLGQDADDRIGSVNGESILKMGRNYKNPLLQLIGTAMQNNKKDLLDKICSLDRCGEWSAWTICPAVKQGQFGMNTRTRECGMGPAFCKPGVSIKVRIEMDSRVCINVDCPSGFTKTENGFCFLLHDIKLKRDAAGKFCGDKGAFVININSKQKDDDLNNFLGKQGYDMWIDGRRGLGNSVWEYKYELEKSGNYSNWEPSQPNNPYSNSEVFIVVSSDGKWYDVSDSSRVTSPPKCSFLFRDQSTEV